MRLVILLRVFLAKDGEETDAHAEQQSAPVHRLTAHHAVIAVLSSVNQRYKIFLDFCYILQSFLYSILHFITLLQRVGNFSNITTMQVLNLAVPDM